MAPLVCLSGNGSKSALGFRSAEDSAVEAPAVTASEHLALVEAPHARPVEAGSEASRAESGSAPHAPSSEAPATSGAPPEAAASAGAATTPHPSIRSAPSPQRLQLILLLVGQDRVYLLSVGVLLLHHGVPLCRHQIQELSLGDLAVAKLIPHAAYLETGTVVCLELGSKGV